MIASSETLARVRHVIVESKMLRDIISFAVAQPVRWRTPGSAAIDDEQVLKCLDREARKAAAGHAGAHQPIAVRKRALPNDTDTFVWITAIQAMSRL